MGTTKPTGIELIAAERKRQTDQEGWTPEHDDEHCNGEMALAAACYAITPKNRFTHWTRHASFLRTWWPWGDEWWKPSPHNRVRELVKAGALIAAEIDRLQRKATQ